MNAAAVNLAEHLDDRNYATWQAAWDNYERECSEERQRVVSDRRTHAA